MKVFEIFYDDLSQAAQKRFIKEGFWHENTYLSTLAIVEIEEDTADNLDELIRSTDYEQ